MQKQQEYGFFIDKKLQLEENRKVNVDDLLQGYQLFFESAYHKAMDFFQEGMDEDIRRFAGYLKAKFALHQQDCFAPFNTFKQDLKRLFKKTLQLYKLPFYKFKDVVNNGQKFMTAYHDLSIKEQTLIDWSLCQYLQLNQICYSSLTDSKIMEFIRFHFFKARVIQPNTQNKSEKVPQNLIKTQPSKNGGGPIGLIWNTIQDQNKVNKNNNHAVEKMEQEIEEKPQQTEQVKIEMISEEEEKELLLKEQQQSKEENEEDLPVIQDLYHKYVQQFVGYNSFILLYKSDIPNKSIQPIEFIPNSVDMDFVWILLTSLKKIVQDVSRNQESSLFFFLRAKLLFPKCDLVPMLQGDYFIVTDKYQESRECYDLCLQLNQFNSTAMCNKGYSFEYDSKYHSENNLERYHIAILNYSKAIEMNPNNWIYYNNVGVCQKALNQKELAAEYFLRSVEVNNQYRNGASRLVEQLPFIGKNNPDIQNLILRSHVLLQHQRDQYTRIMNVFNNVQPLALKQSLELGLLNYPFEVFQFMNIQQSPIKPVLQELISLQQYIIMVAAYSKNLKEFFTYQPVHILWDLYFN